MRSSQIYWGAIPWVVLQLIMVGIVIAWPGLVTALLEKPSNVDPSKIEITIPPSEFGGGLETPGKPADDTAGERQGEVLEKEYRQSK